MSRHPLERGPSANDVYGCAGEQIPNIIQADRRPRYSMFPDHWTVRCQGLQPSLLRVTRRKLLACDAGDHRAWVCWDDLKFIPAFIDDEKGLSGEASRRNLNLVGSCAIGVHRIGPGFRLWSYVAGQSCIQDGKANRDYPPMPAKSSRLME